MGTKFQIDFFEFAFLVEACLPPKPIARTYFFQKVLTTYYKEMTAQERASLYEWVLKSKVFNINNEEYHKAFEARYNPNNQYLVIGTDNNKYECFLLDDKYHSCYIPGNKITYIPEENIKSVTKIEYHG